MSRLVGMIWFMVIWFGVAYGVDRVKYDERY